MAEGHWCTSRSPDVSLRGAKRRGNLAVHSRIVGKPSAKSQLPSRDCTPRALPRASRSGRHVASLLAMTNRGPLPFYRYPIRIGGAAPGAACRSPTMHGRRSVYFSFFIFQSSGFISMRPSPTMHGRKPRAALHVPFSSFHFQPALSLHITLQISSFYGKSTKIRGGTRNVR